MDIVKAVINVKEGVLELEGPQEFVEKYLDQYKSIVDKVYTSPSIPNEDKTEEAVKPPQKRPRNVRPKTGPVCSEKIRELINDGFFKDQRAREDVQKQLLEKGVRYESKIISATLINLFNSGKLQRTGVGKNAKYYSNV